MRVPIVFLAVIAAAIAVAAPAGAKTATIQIQIQHVMHGCHAWSIANKPAYPQQTLRVHAGTSFTVTNNDVMPQTLLQVAGPHVALRLQRMGHTGAATHLTLRTPGTYRFTTKPGEDYPGVHVMTMGKDNVLQLMVVVV